MKALVLALLALGIQAWAGEETIVTVHGVRYEKASAELANPSTLKIVHDAGIVMVPFADLPPEVRARYGYDAEKEAAWIKATQAARWQAMVANGKKEAMDKERKQQAIMGAVEMGRQARELVETGGQLIYDPDLKRVVVRYPWEHPREDAMKAALQQKFLNGK